MGCLTSKPSGSDPKKSRSNSVSSPISPQYKRGLSKDEIQLRIVAPNSCQSFVHCGISIKYAWVSQRGYYPDTPDKDNQDSCSVAPSLFEKNGTLPTVAMFGVYDGHGAEGHLCSRFVSSQVSCESHVIAFIEGHSLIILSTILLSFQGT
jgi:hypothetical protein